MIVMQWYNSANMTSEVIINIVKRLNEAWFISIQSLWQQTNTAPGIKPQIPVQQKERGANFNIRLYMYSCLEIYTSTNYSSFLQCQHVFSYQACPQLLQVRAKPSSLHKHYHWHIL